MEHACLFLTIGAVVSLIYGIGAGWMFGMNVSIWTPWQWVRQFILNYAGSFVGWVCLWIIFNRLSHWITNNYADTPGAWEIFLFIVSFIGITGHLPLASVTLIQNLSEWLKK